MVHNMKKLPYILLVLLILLFAVPVRAVTYYVCDTATGDESGDSFANCMDVADHNSGDDFSGDDIIYLCDTITSTITCPSSGTSGHVITYKGDYAGHAADIAHASPNSNGSNGINTNSKDYLTFDNIEISDSYEGITNGVDVNSDYITITNCTIHGQYNRGVFGKNWTNVIVGGSAGNGNLIYDTGESGTAGGDTNFNTTCDTVLVSYNSLYGDGASTGVDGVGCEGVSNLTVEYNKIYDHYREDGIDIKKDAHDIIIRYNDIYGHDRDDEASGIRLQMGTYNVQIYGNAIHDNRQAGIDIKQGDYGTHSMVNIHIWGNLIYKNGFGIQVSPSGSANLAITGVLIYNNVFAENGNQHATKGGGIQMLFGTNHQVKNNIFYKNTDDTGQTYPYLQFTLDDAVTGESIDYNYYYYPGVSAQDMFIIESTPRTFAEWDDVHDANGDEADQKMTDPDNNDYTLASDSPCIGIGIDLGNDFDDVLDPNNVDFTATPPEVVMIDPDIYGWPIGGYGVTGPIINNQYPTSQQSCTTDPRTVTFGVTSSTNSTCRFSVKGADTCATAYGDLDEEFENTGATTAHTDTDESFNCDAASTLIVICQDDDTSLFSNCLEIIVDVAASGGAPPQPSPGTVTGGGEVVITGSGEVSMY